MAEARKLPRSAVEKPWGVDRLPPPFESSDRRIGEIWFEPPSGFPLLVKYLFTNERLSIQVHPDDDEARARGHEGGKEECWYILAAEPGAQLGIGTSRPLGGDALRAAARSGEIERLLTWHVARPGMFFYIPPGTVHAIGAGIALIEIQQNADITYRLYDYGRPRTLHLDDGVAVARAAPMDPGGQRPVDADASRVILESRHLGIAHINARDPLAPGRVKGPIVAVPLHGTIAADGLAAGAGDCLWVDDVTALDLSRDARLLVGWSPA